MRYQKFAVLAVLGIVSLALVQSASAQQMYITVHGAKQGQFKGTATGGRIAVTGFSYEVDSPRDPASGLPTGKRMHKPITITKEWDGASPEFFGAITQNESLPTVTIEYYKTVGGEAYQTIVLTNASVSSFKQYSTVTSSGAEKWLEDISFTFQKIEITNKASNTTQVDTWNSVAR